MISPSSQAAVEVFRSRINVRDIRLYLDFVFCYVVAAGGEGWVPRQLDLALFGAGQDVLRL